MADVVPQLTNQRSCRPLKCGEHNQTNQAPRQVRQTLRNKGSRSLLPIRLQLAAVLSKAEAFTSLNVRDEVHNPQHQDQCAIMASAILAARSLMVFGYTRTDASVSNGRPRKRTAQAPPSLATHQELLQDNPLVQLVTSTREMIPLICLRRETCLHLLQCRV